MALTDTAIRQAKAGAVDRKLVDDKGLYLLLTASVRRRVIAGLPVIPPAPTVR